MTTTTNPQVIDDLIASPVEKVQVVSQSFSPETQAKYLFDPGYRRNQLKQPNQNSAPLSSRAHAYATAAHASATHTAYRQGFTAFATWCADHSLTPLPADPDTVAAWIAELATDHSPATIDLRLAAISAAHRAASLPSPTAAETVRLVRRGLRRTHGTAQRQARALVTDDIRAMVRPLTDSAIDTRDRAIILLGFAAALRRSELVALDWTDIDDTPEGLIVTVRRSKTDAEGSGRALAVPFGSVESTCPVRAIRRLRDGYSASGAVFRSIRANGSQQGRLSDRAVSLILKKRAGQVGIDPETVSGHSLRAGLATSAARAGVSEMSIAKTTGHKSMQVLRRYVREGQIFDDLAASKLGL